MNETGEQKAPRKKMKKWKKVLLIIIAVPLALFIALIAWAAYDESKMTPEEKAARDVSRAVAQSERESSIAASQSEAAVKESESQALDAQIRHLVGPNTPKAVWMRFLPVFGIAVLLRWV